MKSSRTRLMLMDDHACVLEALKYFLETSSKYEIVAAVSDARTAVSSACESKPDVILLDVNLPEINGIQLAKLLRKSCPRAAILGFSAYEDRETVMALMRAGVSGFVPKCAGREELLEAIAKVAAGGVFFSPRISSIEADKSHGQPNPALLTNQQRRIIALVAAGLRNKEIATQMKTSVRTVEKQREKIEEKLHISGAAELTRFALHHGLVSLE